MQFFTESTDQRFFKSRVVTTRRKFFLGYEYSTKSVWSEPVVGKTYDQMFPLPKGYGSPQITWTEEERDRYQKVIG